MKISLPDVNLLLALSAEGHIHHKPARSWFYGQLTNSVAICRVTQMGLLRLLTNSKALGRGARTVRQAWDIQHALETDPRIIFANEPANLQPVWEELMILPGVGASSWTDAYLAAFARERRYQLVTFDKGFKRWRDLDSSILVGA